MHAMVAVLIIQVCYLTESTVLIVRQYVLTTNMLVYLMSEVGYKYRILMVKQHICIHMLIMEMSIYSN